MNENKEVTIEEAMQYVVNTLEDINIPAKYMEQIGYPINQSITNLKNCLLVIEKNKEQESKENDTIDLGNIDFSDIDSAEGNNCDA